ncbi:MAG: Gfo/Idh/MocA family oxidoreductase [Verrucomicrobia bacterium]|nr:Gfo/Idh/MocA family oxidoreductase [Verrucomicrobiota bacterium]
MKTDPGGHALRRRGMAEAFLVFVRALAVLCAPLAAWAQPAPNKIGIGLYGSNGHQLALPKFAAHPHARLVAVAAVRATRLPEGVKRCASLDELLADPQIELISLCSPRRADQARDAILCLKAGRHVYAEKPVALTEAELDQVLAVARHAGKEFHEMAGTVFVPEYAIMRKLVRAGAVGEVIQVFVQKSYRYGAARPQDEAIDGGLFLQAGIHAARMIEHVGGVRMKSVTGWETMFGKPAADQGDGKVAGAAQAELENGGLATIIMNYLNPPGTPLLHGNETLRVFGTKGFIESVDGGMRTRLVTAGKVVEPLEKVPGLDYFDALAAHLVNGAAMPLTLDEELHPLRLLLRAKEKMRAAATP